MIKTALRHPIRVTKALVVGHVLYRRHKKIVKGK
jgi:hypothetical protein